MKTAFITYVFTGSVSSCCVALCGIVIQNVNHFYQHGIVFCKLLLSLFNII